VDIVYPRGASLNVQEPAVPIITSGYIAYPLNRPIAAAYLNKVCICLLQCCHGTTCACPEFTKSRVWACAQRTGTAARESEANSKYHRVPKFWTYGSVCCSCAQRHGLPRQSFSRTQRSQKTKHIFHWVQNFGTRRYHRAVEPSRVLCVFYACVFTIAHPVAENWRSCDCDGLCGDVL
jgi:hypothetical protein